MSSPFPGMDPYIEDPEIWGDFHAALATEIRTQLNRTIQPRYVARLIPMKLLRLLKHMLLALILGCGCQYHPREM